MPADRWPTRLMNPPAGLPVFEVVPRVVGVQITGRCQLRCRHCFNRSGPHNSHELPLAIIERLLEAMGEWGVDDLRVSGGEPTFHRRFKEVVEGCSQRGIRIALNTHGVYSQSLLAWAENAPIDLFLVSIDGWQENHDAIRGRGTFARAVRTCERLRRAGQRVMVAYHVGAGNRADVARVIRLAAEIGVDFKLSPIRPLGRAREELPEVLIRPADYLEIVRQVTNLRRRFPHIRIATDFDILYGSSEGWQRDPDLLSCGAGRTMININYDGEIYPCAFFADPEARFSAGNLYTDSLTEVWSTSPVFEPFRVHRKSSRCQACGHYQRRCAGGCPAIAHTVSGCLDAHDPTCFAGLVDPPPGAPP